MALILCLTVNGCTRTGDAVMTYGDSQITENEFRYYLSYYKGVFLDSFTDMKDIPSYYRKTLDNGQTMEEYLHQTVVDNVSMTLICMELFDKEDLAVSENMKKQISDNLEQLVEDYANGDEKALNAELAAFGVNIDMLQNIYINQEKSGFLFDYLYGDSGTEKVTDAERQAYFEENYCRMQHIYINNAYQYVLTEEGYLQYSEDGEVITAPLPEEIQTVKDSAVTAVETALASGEDFNKLYQTYSEDRLYKNGYYLTRKIDFIDEVVDAAFALEIGEFTRVESAVGTHFILRLPPDEKPWENPDNADFFDTFEESLRSELFMQYVRGHLPDVQIDTEKVSAYTVEKSPVNYRF